jgi:predicted permease
MPMAHILARLREAARRIAGTMGRRRCDADLEDELRAHLEMAAEQAKRTGASPAEAARDAMVRVGSLTQAIEAQRGQAGVPWIADASRDLRLGLRRLAHDRVFAAAVVLSLALGIGANVSLFALIHAVVLRPLPVRAPDELATVVSHYPDPSEPRRSSLSHVDYERVRDHARAFSDLAGTSPVRVDVAGDGISSENVHAEYVVGHFFPMLGIHAAIGRLIDERDDVAGGDVNVAVVSWQYWQHTLGGTPSSLGRFLSINGARVSIVGVAPRGFTGVVVESATDIWIPMALHRQIQPSPSNDANDEPSLLVLGRRAPSMTIAQASAELRVLLKPTFDQIAERSGDPKWHDVSIDVESARTGFSQLREALSRPLAIVMAGAAVLLLLACVNLASLLLARGIARQREMALRMSLGAGRWRLMRQVLAESLLLACGGTAAGILVARLGVVLLVHVIGTLYRHAESLQLAVGLDVPGLLFTAAIGVVTTVLVGIVPAWQAGSAKVAPSLRDGRSVGDSKGRRRFGAGLIAAQIALSTVLLSTSAVFERYLSGLRNDDLGFDRHSVLLVTLNPRGSRVSSRILTDRYRQLLDRFRAIPGVRSATLGMTTPIAPGEWLRRGNVDGVSIVSRDQPYVYLNAVAPGFFETFGTPLLAGRDFQDVDRSGPRVAIVNQAMARRHFADRTPIGHRLTFDNDRDEYEIVGVVADAKYDDLHRPAPQTVYLNAFQAGQIGSQFALRTDVPPTSIADAVRAAVEAVVGPVRLENITTLDDQIDASLVLERVLATISWAFSVFGTALAAVGLYGLLAYSVSRRTNEIGVRMALGATRPGIVRLVLRGAIAMVAIGLAFGVPAALWSQRLAASLIVSLPVGTIPIVIASLILFGVAFASAGMPAWRATRIKPVDALRHE